MCYTVVKSTEQCDFGHALKFKVCWRQCRRQAEQSQIAWIETQDTAEWNNLCDLEHRTHANMIIQGPCRRDYEPPKGDSAECQVCENLQQLPEYNSVRGVYISAKQNLAMVKASYANYLNQQRNRHPDEATLEKQRLKHAKAYHTEKFNQLVSLGEDLTKDYPSLDMDVYQTLKLEALELFDDSSSAIYYGPVDLDPSEEMLQAPQYFPHYGITIGHNVYILEWSADGNEVVKQDDYFVAGPDDEPAESVEPAAITRRLDLDRLLGI